MQRPPLPDLVFETERVMPMFHVRQDQIYPAGQFLVDGCLAQIEQVIHLGSI